MMRGSLKHVIQRHNQDPLAEKILAGGMKVTRPEAGISPDLRFFHFFAEPDVDYYLHLLKSGRLGAQKLPP